MGMTTAVAGKGRFNLNQNSDINVTPFVDVMLVLLIVMMVTAPLATVAVKMDIPPPPSGVPTRPPTVVLIADDGTLAVTLGTDAAKPSSLDALAKDVAASLGTADVTQTHVFVRAQRHVTYGRFMTVMNQLKLAHYQHIGLVTEEMRR